MERIDSLKDNMNWYCVYTKPKSEDIVCNKLSVFEGIECLNPKLKRNTLVRKKPVELTEALFPCYIFLKFNASKYYHLIKNTRGVKRVLCNGAGEPYIVNPNIIEILMQKMQNNYIDISSVAFEDGDQVEVKSGVLKGLKGILSKGIKRSERVLVLLNALEYQANIEISRNLLVKV